MDEKVLAKMKAEAPLNMEKAAVIAEEFGLKVISEVLNVDESIDVSGIFNVIGHIEQKQDHVSNLLFRLSSESMENIDSLNTL